MVRPIYKDLGHAWGMGFYVDTIDGRTFTIDTVEYKEWYEGKIEEYKKINPHEQKKSN